MTTSRYKIRLGACALAFSLVAPTVAMSQDAGEGAIKARQGYMQLAEFTVGPLFGIAKGEMPYDAEQAKAIAANLQALTKYNGSGAWIPGTSKTDMPGKTRAKTAIWEDGSKFGPTFGEYVANVNNLVAQAGEGQEALAAAVSEVGKSCGACHKAFRAKEF